MKIFILEDDYLSMAMYEAFFKKDFEVFKAHSAEEFTDTFEKANPDVALIDVNIKNPDFTGIDLVSNLSLENSETKFILTTAYQEDDVGKPHWCNVFHPKPVNLAILKRQIDELLA